MSTSIAVEPIQYTLHHLDGKWRIPLLTTLFQIGSARYSILQQHIPTIGSKMLSTELKALEQLHLVERITTESPVLIAYQLSAKGRSLYPILEALSLWGERELAKKPTQLTHHNKHEINHFLTINI